MLKWSIHINKSKMLIIQAPKRKSVWKLHFSQVYQSTKTKVSHIILLKIDDKNDVFNHFVLSYAPPHQKKNKNTKKKNLPTTDYS